MKAIHLTPFQYISTFILLLMMTNTVAVELPPMSHQLSSVEELFPAPPMDLSNTIDQRVNLSDLMGQVVVLNFWASWCLPCRREMASLEQLHRLTGESNIKVITVNLGEAKDTVIEFVDSIEPAPTFPVLLDANSSSAVNWNVKGLPTTYILSEQGRIVFKALGGRDFEHPDMIQKIRQLSSVN